MFFSDVSRNTSPIIRQDVSVCVHRGLKGCFGLVDFGCEPVWRYTCWCTYVDSVDDAIVLAVEYLAVLIFCFAFS